MEKGFNISLRGVSHETSGIPMQDYSGTAKCDDYSIAVVCDGHGSPKHFRSHVGSQLATEVAIGALKEFADTYPTYDEASYDFARKANQLRGAIVRSWMAQIEQNINDNPFTKEELDYGAKDGKPYFTTYTKYVPYGTTMLTALLCKDYYALFMIGDGAIIKLNPNEKGELVQFDGKRTGDRVESMCNSNAVFKIYYKIEKITEEEKDVAFALASDGFCESEAFTSKEVMIDFAKLYLSHYADVGLETAVEEITPYLYSVSKRGSAQDDVSLAFAVNNLKAYRSSEEEEEAKSAQEASNEAPTQEEESEEKN